MAVPKTPLPLVGFFFLFTFVASQPMDGGVLGAPGDKACLMALDIPGPGTSCDDRLRNAKVLNVREALRNIPKPLLDQVDVLIDQIKASAPALTELLKPSPRRERAKFLKLLNALGSLKFADWLRDCAKWCESKKDTTGISCATKSTNMGSIIDRLSCISVA